MIWNNVTLLEFFNINVKLAKEFQYKKGVIS